MRPFNDTKVPKVFVSVNSLGHPGAVRWLPF